MMDRPVDPAAEARMPSFEQKYYRRNPSLAARLARDIALIAENLVLLWLWATRGRRLRRAVREAERRGESIRIDDLAGGGE